MELYELILESAEKGLRLQQDDGSFPRGHNGPWGHNSTYVRTTAHWALLLHKAYLISDNSIYLSASFEACDYLINEECRPYGYSFNCLQDEYGFWRPNGLIGQAWAVEPLIFIGKKHEKENYLEVAENVLKHHRYDFYEHGWCEVEIDGKKHFLPSGNLNKRLWFSTMALILGEYLDDEWLTIRAYDFFGNFPFLVKFLDDGLVNDHLSYNKRVLSLFKKLIQILLSYRRPDIFLKKKIKSHLKDGGVSSSSKSLGYLTFTLYGLALAYKYDSDARFWENEKLKSILRASIEYIESNYPFGYLEGDEFRWQYNPVGIETAFVLETFSEYLELNLSEDEITKWLEKQFEGYYDFEKNLMMKNTCDPEILSSRLYEAIRLENYEIRI